MLGISIIIPLFVLDPLYAHSMKRIFINLLILSCINVEMYIEKAKRKPWMKNKPNRFFGNSHVFIQGFLFSIQFKY